MIKTYLLIFLLLTLSCLALLNLQSCRDKDEPEYECTPDITVLLPEKAVSMFCFKEGSYWIYQREDSLYTDSVWVTSAHEYIRPVNTKVHNYFKGQKCYQSRSTFFTSGNGYLFFSSKFSLQTDFPDNTSSYSEEWFSLYENPTLSSGNSPQVRIEYGGNELAQMNSFGDSAFHLDSITIKNTVYSDVVRFKKHASFKDYLKEAYYAPGYGMIRFKDIHDAWWDLIRYNIIQ